MARERDIRNEIKELLMATGAFSDVWLTGLPEEGIGQPASELAAASVEPESTQDSDRYDGGAETGSVRTALLTITFLQRMADAQLCDEACEDLLMLAENTLNGASLLGFNFPDRSKFIDWRWLHRKPPERRIAGTYSYDYLVEGWASNDTAP